MIALRIADVKTFMKKLLLSESFDHFLLLEGSITTFNTFHIDGTLQTAYYDTDARQEAGERALSFWGEVRPFCFELIRGKRSPLGFRFTLQLSRSNTERLLTQTGVDLSPEQVRGLLMNLRYDGRELTCTTGTSLSVFTMDKNLDHAWDDMVQRYFHQQGIPCETL